MKTAFLVAFLSLSTVSFAQLNGTRTVCASGCDYTSLTQAGGAFAALNSVGINGNLVLEIRGNLTETGANVLGNYTDIGGPHTITIRPQNNVMRTISGTNNSQGLIVLTGADRVIIDGRNPADPIPSYTNRYLTIRNTSTTAPAMAISNDAVSCSIRSTIIEGANTNATGVVNVSGGSTSGNDDLVIDYCDIKDGASRPLTAIAVDGGSQSNDNVQITNNRIFDFFTTTYGGIGINIGNNNSNFLISSNSFYQTVDRSNSSNIVYYCIQIQSTGSAFNIVNNFFGGSAEGATGTVRSISATGNHWVYAKLINIEQVGTATPSVISGNIIRGINISSTQSAVSEAHFSAISVTRGTVQARNNVIGGTIANSNITVTFNAAASSCVGTVNGISFETNGGGAGIEGEIEGNTVDNMQLNLAGSTTSVNSSTLAGIYVNQRTGSNTITVRKNLIGHLSGAATFLIGNVAVPASASALFRGIMYSGTRGTIIIDRNKIANCSNGAATNGVISVISVTNPLNAEVTGNEIFNITSAATSNASTSGIGISGAGAGSVSVSRNIVYGITSGSGSGVNGITLITAATVTQNPQVDNNMITLGNGGATTNTNFRGLTFMGSAGTVRVYANSVAIIGSATGSLGTNAIYRNGATPVNLDLRANLTVNTRSGGTGMHSAFVGDAAFTGITANHNLWFSSVAGNLTSFNGTLRTYATWQTASGQDANSRNFNISSKFINAATGNLRIPDDGSADVTNNIVDKGAATAGVNPVSVDIDNATRTAITDIGASEVMVMWLGTTNSIWTTATNWSGGIVPSCGGREMVKIGPNITGVVLNQPTISIPVNFRDLIILEGATVTLTNPGALTQCATGVSPYSLTNNGTLIANGRTITLYGDFVQNGTYTPGGGTVFLTAASTQSIKGDVNPVTFEHLSINGGGAKTLQQAVRVNGILVLNNGIVNTSTAYPLTLSTAGSYTGGSNTSHINGPLAKETNSTSPRFVFPIGKGGKLRPAIIEPSNTLASTFSAEYFNQSAIDNIGTNKDGSILSVSDVEYWRINRIGSANAFVTLTWDAASFVSANQADRDLLGVVRWNGFQWSNHFQSSNTGTQASGEVTSQFIGVFDTYFTLGSSTVNNPLPIELLYFRAALAEGMVRAEWATEMERAFDRFELEKASKDMMFTKIGEVQSLSSGEPRTLRKYSYVDQNPYIGDNYYRLKAIDMDGTFKYYNVVRVFNPGEGTLNVYPNPILSSEVLKVEVDFTPTPQDKVTLMNLQGVEMLHTDIQVGGVHEITLGNNVKPGFYLLRYNSPAFQKTFKVVVK